MQNHHGTAGPVWVIAEADQEGLPQGTLEAAGEGRELADALHRPFHLLIPCTDPGPLEAPAGRLDADVLHFVSHPALHPYTTPAWLAACLPPLSASQPLAVLVSGSPNGEDLAARLAARLRWPFFHGCIWARAGSGGELRLVQPVEQGRLHHTYAIPPGSGPVVVTLQPGAIGHAGAPRPRQPLVHHRQAAIDPSLLPVRVLETRPADPAQVDLAEAERIVAGGRGAGDPKNWRLLEALAAALQAAVGGSRPALDLGLIPRQRMIGQTGRSVSPRLYIAAGISGATHHLSAVRAGRLVAINTDPAAPILRHAALSIHGDLQAILPCLLQRLGASPPEEAP